jgi:MscS family membrane protein
MRAVRWFCVLALLFVGTHSFQVGASQGRPAEGEPLDEVADPLGRSTPRGALRGFQRAGHERDWSRAGQYLDLGGRRRIGDMEPAALAERLYGVLDRKLWVPIASLSDVPDGHGEDGLPASFDALGSIETGEGPVELRLKRGAGGLWRFSPDSVARIPELYGTLGQAPLARFLPADLASRTFLGLDVVHWLGLAGLLLVSFLLAYALTPLLVRLTRPLAGLRRGEHAALRDAHGPLRFLIALTLFVAGAGWLGLPARVVWTLRAIETVLWIAGGTWLLTRLLDIWSQRLATRLGHLGRHSAVTMMPLGRKAAKAVVILIALMTMLQTFGVDVTAVVAGLGIGGIAIALAAQKTVENLFGGVSLIVDQPILVGDLAKVGDVTGTVEEIGLRSTRLRTPDRTVVSIPNGQLATQSIENFARRDKMWLRVVVAVRPDTSADQLRDVLTAIQRLLAAHPRLERGARVRLIGFGAQSFDLEIVGTIPTANADELLVVREDLLLRILGLLRDSGTGLALPAQVQYDMQGHAIDPELRSRAEQRVAAAREAGRIPFPELPPEEAASLAGTLDWPPRGTWKAAPREPDTPAR